MWGTNTTQGLDDTTLTAEVKYPINFTQSEKIVYTIMEATVSNLLMVQKGINSKQKS